ncbi:MAG: tRNA 2-selenouridine(34) synthase MnmH [Burkholderiales bacterium]|nr:tRNA 2-selenouridine(34) synthase MnmH [Burkholderiales bacterium]
MPLTTIAAPEALQQLDSFSAVIDARSESEFALDRLPGAVNWPSLNDAERASVGTEYKQVSPFAAKKRGAMLVARNVAAHIERHVLELPRDWSPLVYCWRGGQRSGSLGLVLGQIGFRVHLLEGGYQAFRRAVVAALETLPASLSLIVVCGTTGSGKSLLLRALAERGEQVLDLETLANHRGSVLGLVPGEVQPSQKAFDTAVWNVLRRFDPTRPVFVESESAKVGDLRVPPALVERMRGAPCLLLDLPIDARVALLLREYAFFVRDVEAFCTRLDALRVLRGHSIVNAWQEAARADRIAAVVRDLLHSHYDPIYLQSMARNFTGSAAPLARVTWDGSDEGLRAAAEAAVAALTRTA